jgi:Domain of unknown function (DUF6379)
MRSLPMSLAATMLETDALRAAADGFELDIRLNWYRSLPLSSVQTVELTVDGEAIRRADVTFVLNGREYALDELANHWDEPWFVLDAATLRVRRPRAVEAGRPADVRLRLGTRVPYIQTAPGQPLEYVTERAMTLVAR